MEHDDIETLRLGGQSALSQQFSVYRERLERMIEFRLDARLRGRIDPEDVLQETWIDAARRLPDYLATPQVSLYVWLRQLTYQSLINIQRRHFGQKRDPRQEFTLPQQHADATSYSIAACLLGQHTSPSEALLRQEEWDRLQSVLSSMDPTDREVLALRHFEQLGNNQVAEVLGISVTAASNRYVRALQRLSEFMSS
ncbi:MAG: sigma-70 family RNA polymerase sigma factor [Planctomycetales bacterium]|nr:sigma-70 family RNA polymerase sigma factor [Planctomycetales bacterium]MCA9167094.1 sigma-70 family RNA polymerase sigma factor [Planctomycetales bacterium]